MDLAAFKVKFPEFQSAGDTLVQTFLDSAAAVLSETYWDTYYDEGHGWLAAALLATSPSGQNARLVAEEGDSTYARTFQALRIEVTAFDRIF